jgi:hypothetical protein
MRADYFIARFRIIGSDFVGSVDADGSSIQYGTVHNRRVLYGQAHTPQPTGTRQGYNIHTVVSTSVFAPPSARARTVYGTQSSVVRPRSRTRRCIDKNTLWLWPVQLTIRTVRSIVSTHKTNSDDRSSHRTVQVHTRHSTGTAHW